MTVHDPDPFVPGQLTKRLAVACPYCRVGLMTYVGITGWLYCANTRCGAQANIGHVQERARALAARSPRQHRTTGEFTSAGIQPAHPS